MELNKRGFDAVQPMGLLLNDLKVQCFISNDLVGNIFYEFFLGTFEDVNGLLKLMNKRLHNCASQSAEQIFSIIKEKAVDKKRKVAALIKNTVPRVKFPILDYESDKKDGEVDNEEDNEN
uniref:Uncharacterized protein n=1 Tax=Amphimedon queenslandica TaxID=400682 RepID=A0A1X7TTH4_AMPQE